MDVTNKSLENDDSNKFDKISLSTENVSRDLNTNLTSTNQESANVSNELNDLDNSENNIVDEFHPEISDKSKEEISVKENNLSVEEKIRFYFLPVVAVVFILIIWFKLYSPIVIDEWNKGIIHVEKSVKISDKKLSTSELEKGGDILKKQNRLHPYHARVWHLLGKYYLIKEKWDSCIYAEKKAIELGSGGIVNQVEFMAADNLNLALQQQLNNIKNLDSSLMAIKHAELKSFDNFIIDKFKGLVFSKFKQQDSAIFYLNKFLKIAPEDGYVLIKLSENYVYKNDKKNAELYFKKAIKIEKDNPRIDSLKIKISMLPN
jgi:tetratricopeptide (TPR) repeat protein